MIKQAVSVSLGSRTRDAESEINLLGQTVRLRREGWDGDVAQVTARFAALDGRVEAFGVGGIDLWIYANGRRYKLHAAHKLITQVHQTPIVDGGGLKNTLEAQIANFLAENFPQEMGQGRVLVTSGLDRSGMADAFFSKGHEVICGDLGFALALPFPIRHPAGLDRLGRYLAPIVTRLPISVLYPTGDKQNEINPKFPDWYSWADIIAGDCLYIKQHMPDKLTDKIIVTNTTTPADRELFMVRDVKAIVTTTPMIDGRTFGTNLFEAGLTAAAGKNRSLTPDELQALIVELNLQPTITYRK